MSDIAINDHSGSINQNVAPHLLKDNECVLSVNTTDDMKGAISHRLGSTLLGNVTAAAGYVRGLGSYIKAATDEKLLRVVGGDLEGYTEGTDTWAVLSAGVRGATSDVNFANYINKIYFTGSGATEYLKNWDGSNVSTVSGNIQGKYIATGNNRLVIGGGTTLPRRIYYSELGTEVFDTTNDYIDLDEPVTGVTAFGEQQPFLGFTDRNIYVFDPNSGYSRKIEGYGCPSHRSIAVVKGRAIWLARDGIYMFSPDQAFPEKISELIENEWWGDALFNQISPANFSTASAGVFSSKYFLSVGDLASTVEGETLNDCWLVFDIAAYTWRVRTYTTNGAGVVFTNWVDDDGDPWLVSGSRDDKSTYLIEVPGVFTDDTSGDVATAVTAFHRTRHHHFGGKEFEKTLTTQKGYIEFYAESALTIKYARNGSNTYETWTTTGTTTSSVDYDINSLTAFAQSDIRTLSIEYRGTGKWSVYTFGIDFEKKNTVELVEK